MLNMAGHQIPQPLGTFPGLTLDSGTLALIRSPRPGPVGLSTPTQKHWYAYSSLTGFAAPTLTTSPDGVALLKGIETLQLKPYDDQTAKAITQWVKGATIGYGHLIAKGEWPTYKDGITQEQADALFAADLAPYERLVGECITAKLQQYQFDALVILAFNIGPSFKNSSVVKLVNDPQAITSYASLEEAWKAWNKSQGKVMIGLDNRRNAEWSIYTKAIYARW